MKSLFEPKIRIVWAMLSALCLLYSAMVFLVHSGTFSFSIWVAGAAFFAACYFFAGKNRWSRVPALLRYIVYAVLGVSLSVFIICEAAILSHFFDKGEENLDYIVVLGAQMRDYGPSVIYRYRLQKAAEYLEENPGTICITTGTQGSNESISEGQGGKDYLISLGVDESRIIAETDSTTTGQNIENAFAIIGEDNISGLKIGIVTNGFHVFRGVHIARKLTDADVCGIAAYMQPQYIPNNMVRECFGIIRDFVFR
ncbi:YdcF family protein [Butyrivibrio sp. AE3006]|uniref:YdcF family protein n=1 Tax=Butyrivibrio sp. AE3006 TaxID=1280673 RepID=UPI000429C70F|nr:YdcF family protein [Butyrivibrio sp. AE3006]